MKGTTVNHRRRELAHDYALGLQHYLAEPEEPALARAHELGRKALTDGLGVLEMATIHSQAIAATLDGRLTDAAKTRLLDGLERFFVQALAPFEMAHRGFWEANIILHRLNDVLEGQAKRIAFALHDEAAQLLAAVHLALADLATRLPPEHARDLQSARALLDQMQDMLDQDPPWLVDPQLSVRNMASGALRKIDPHWEKLEPALRAIPGLKVALQNTDYWVRQAASEVLAKLDKSHIHATQPGETDSAIVVRQHADRIVCSIQDDGIGLKRSAPAAEAPSRGLGLVEIQERAAALGGQLRLSGAETPGTNVTIEIPLEP